MKPISTDVDIDVFDRDSLLRSLECIYGRIDRDNDQYEKHPTGVYFQNIPRDPTNNVSTLDHRIANDYGYFKLDFLNVNMYEGIRNESHLLELINREPPWDFFQYKDITDKLFHMKGHSALLQKYKPESVEDLSCILAIIRPAKAYLQQHDWDRIRRDVWLKSEGIESYQFKKSHALSYSLAIVVNLNLLIEKLSKD